VTGASSGIGYALAMELARYQTKLIVTARRQNLLDALADEIAEAGSEACCIAGDITDAEHRRQLLAAAEDRFGGLDMLVNNAGLGAIGTFASADETRLRSIMEVNFFAAAETTRAALPLLRHSSDGVVVNIGSVLGHCAVPKKSEYCASKFALHGLTDALRMEEAQMPADERIDIVLISPSTTSSSFFDNALRSEGNAAQNSRAMSPEAVAKQTVRAVERRRRELILSSSGKLLVWADRLWPSLMSRLLGRFG